MANTDPRAVTARLAAVAERIARLDQERAELAAERDALIRELRDRGWTLGAIGALARVTPQGVYKLLRDRRENR